MQKEPRTGAEETMTIDWCDRRIRRSWVEKKRWIDTKNTNRQSPSSAEEVHMNCCVCEV